jgi:glycosyltransferase involved in cell wall biosynthesis
MKLVSTTITNSRADVIGPMLEAIAPHVDACVVIDTGATDDTMKIAAEVCGAKFRPWPYKWPNDFAQARNFALELARAAGADWAIQADTDEVYDFGEVAPRDFLPSLAPEKAVVVIPHVSRGFGQPRCIRTSADVRWNEPVHEYLGGYDPVRQSAPAPSAWNWATVDRPGEDLDAKYRGYVKILEKRTRERPEIARSWYYLGDSYCNVRMHANALAAWDRRVRVQKVERLRGSYWEAGWAAWRAAVLRYELGKPLEALATCKRGLEVVPHMIELAWFSGWLEYQGGNFAQALYWANHALALPLIDRQGGFSYARAHRTLPLELKRWAEHQITAGAAPGRDATSNECQP